MYAQASSYDENPFSSGSAEARVPLAKAAETSPAWLAEPVATGQANTSSGGDGGVPGLGEVDAAVPRMILYSRVINLLLSVCMIVASLLCTSSSPLYSVIEYTLTSLSLSRFSHFPQPCLRLTTRRQAFWHATLLSFHVSSAVLRLT